MWAGAVLLVIHLFWSVNTPPAIITPIPKWDDWGVWAPMYAPQEEMHPKEGQI